MLIREMTIDDYDEVYKLWLSEESVGFRSLDDSKDGIEKFLLRNPSTSFVGVENDEIIDTILSGSDARRGYIYHAMIKRELRCRGYGRRQVQKACYALRSLGINRIAF